MLEIKLRESNIGYAPQIM